MDTYISRGLTSWTCYLFVYFILILKAGNDHSHLPVCVLQTSPLTKREAEARNLPCVRRDVSENMSSLAYATDHYRTDIVSGILVSRHQYISVTLSSNRHRYHSSTINTYVIIKEYKPKEN